MPSSSDIYRPSDYGREEEEMIKKLMLQFSDSKHYFLTCVRPRLDRAYKLYIAYNGDRSLEIKSWQSNVFVPYVQAVIETMIPRILDARPDFNIQGRNPESQAKAANVQQLHDYTWEKSRADSVMEECVRASLIYGTGYLQAYWKKDVRTHKFLESKDIASKKLSWTERKQTFYDAPTLEWVDNYDLWYDWHNVKRERKQFWFKRLILTGEQIKRRYPGYDPKRLDMALNHGGGDLMDYAAIRNQVRLIHYYINKGSDYRMGGQGGGPWGGLTNALNIYMSQSDPELKMHEVLEWWRPFEDAYSVIVNYTPILKGGYIPIPYNFKEAPFIDIPYLRPPHEFEGYGIPHILENPQIMLNMIKNQRLDAATMSIHKMWIVNPLANINKMELVTRPFGIIYSTDPNGVREVQFSDIKASAYQEEDRLKQDMRYASGVDDFSMGQGESGTSATAVRHLRESTLERVRLFVNHIGEGLSVVMRYWTSMYQQFMTKSMTIRIVGEDGNQTFPEIKRDDIMGEFDFRATVLPSIAGQNDINKKQGMDLFQLLINMPFIDPKKLVGKVLSYWGWDINTISAAQAAGEGLPGAPGEPGAEAGMAPPSPLSGMTPALNGVPPELAARILGGAGTPTGAGAPSGFAEASAPINLFNQPSPPTVAGVPAAGGGPGPRFPERFPMATTNPRGANRKVGGKVNTNINVNQNSNPESALLNRTFNIQR